MMMAPLMATLSGLAIFSSTVLLLTVSANDDCMTPVIRIPGDLDILAVLHYRERANGLHCTGSYRHRVPYDVETLRYAIDRANEGVLSNRSVRLGLTVVDACGSPAVAFRDVSAAISGTNADLPTTGPTIGILLPGFGGVTKMIVEQISQRMGIATIGYLPTEEMYLSFSDLPSSEMFVDVRRGDIGFINEVDRPPPDRPDVQTTAAAPTNNGRPTDKPSTPLPTAGATTSIMAEGTDAMVGQTGMTDPDRNAGNAEEDRSEDCKVFGGPVNPAKTYVWSSAVALDDEASVIRVLLTEAGWLNVGVFYSGYGAGPFRRAAFLEQAYNSSICVAFDQAIPAGLTQEIADDILEEVLESAEPARVIVWLVSPAEVEMLLRSLRLRSERFYGVGSSAWNSAINRGLFPTSLLAEANGTIFIDDRLFERVPEGLRGHFDNINSTTSENLWLDRTIDVLGENGSDYAIAPHTNSLVRAIGFLARASESYLAKTCGDRAGVCPGAYDANNGSIFDEIEQLSGGNRFSNTYGVNLVLDGLVSQIGNASRTRTNLTIQLNQTFGPIARSDDCKCTNGRLELIEPVASPWTHTLADDHWVPAIFAVSALFGLFAVLIFFGSCWFFKYPSMNKSTVVANLLLLIGIMLMYFISLFFTRRPNELVCGFRQFGTAFIHAWVFSALLVKSLGTYLTLECKDGYIAEDSKDMKCKLSKKAQLAAFIALMAPQIALSVQWIIMSPPEVVSNPNVCGVVECNVSNVHIILSMIYVYILVTITWALSCCRIRDDRLIQESRSVSLSCLCTMFLMVAWAVSFTRADPIYQIPAICLGVTANATVILLACFGPCCCVFTYGRGTYNPQNDDKRADDDAGDEIAYVNPAFLGSNDESATAL